MSADNIPSKPSYEFLRRENVRLNRDISTIYSRSAKRSPAHRIAHDSMTFNAVDEWNTPETSDGPTPHHVQYDKTGWLCSVCGGWNRATRMDCCHPHTQNGRAGDV